MAKASTRGDQSPRAGLRRDEQALRREIIETCLKMNALGINQGTSGNVSARWNDGILITPSGLAYEETKAADIVALPFDRAKPSKGRRKPSSEWRFHIEIMSARPEVAAVVHTHSVFAAGFSMLRKALPACHYMIAASGGPTIRCAAYATVGTQKLSDNVLKALEGRNCCLLANHGVIATGPSLEKALWLAGEVETLAQQYAIALQMGQPKILSNAEIARVAELFKGYGPDAQSTDT